MNAEPPADDGRIAQAWQNRVAGRALRLARASMEGGPSKQAAFAARLERELGISLSVGAYSNYENGRRTVPAAVLIEAIRLASRSMDDVLSEAGQPELDEWVSALSISQRITEVERSLASLMELLGHDQVAERASVHGSALAPLQRQLERQGELLAQVVSTLDEADLWHPRTDAAASRSGTSEGRGSG